MIHPATRLTGFHPSTGVNVQQRGTNPSLRKVDQWAKPICCALVGVTHALKIALKALVAIRPPQSNN